MTAIRHGLVLLAEGIAAAGWLGAVVVWPPVHRPAHSDVVVLLSGDGARLAGAVRLMRQQVAPTLLFVGQPDTVAVAELCRNPQAFDVVCVRPTPDDTRTEAQAAGHLARTRKWRSMLLVTSRYHIARARMLFSRCFRGTLDAVGDYPHYGSAFARGQVAHEWLGLLYASVFTRAC